MGRHSQGWTIRRAAGRTVWLVRFTEGGVDVEKSTGERDRGKASRKAAEIYAEAISGIVRPKLENYSLVGLASDWVADYTMTHAAGTALGAEGYMNTLTTYFEDFERFTEAGYAGYMRMRIATVSRATLRKELSALRMFVDWLKQEKGLAFPEVPGLPKKGHAGARGKNARRRQATILSPAEVTRILAAMPDRGPRSGAWVRPFFTLLWETGLRPYSTLARLENPLHWSEGRRDLFISREIDKAKYERTVPLTATALATLEQTGGTFPGVNDGSMRPALESAVIAAAVKKVVSIYDFRHSRISQLANSGAPLAGVAFLVGHKDISTTAKYVQTSAQAASAALSWGGNRGAETGLVISPEDFEDEH